MPDEAQPLDATDKELLGQIIGFAIRRAHNGVYLNMLRSESRGNLPVLFLVAVGEQALAVQQILLANEAPRESPIEIVSDLSKIEGNGKW
jgi:hypothetical protein